MRNQLQFGMIRFLIFMVLGIDHQVESCSPSGRIRGVQAPKDQCDSSEDDCCQANKFYTVFECSPPITQRTKAILTINNFEKGGDGGGPAECDNHFHSNKLPVVALSTGWFAGRQRCHKFITIFGNGRSVRAMVVDECDSTAGCDDVHGFQAPCPNNIVDGSQAVWESLGVPKSDWGTMEVFWSDH